MGRLMLLDLILSTSQLLKETNSSVIKVCCFALKCKLIYSVNGIIKLLNLGFDFL